MTFATVTVPIVIPEGHVAGYDVGVDYHATGADFINTAFISQYDTPSVRQTVQTQLQGMADRGATLISTRLWLVLEPGTPNSQWRLGTDIPDDQPGAGELALSMRPMSRPSSAPAEIACGWIYAYFG